MSNIILTVEEINKLQPLDIVTHPTVRQRFIQIYDTLWGSGEAAYERESNYFNRILADNAKLQKVAHFSIFTAFIDLAVNGLTLEPGTRAQCYLMGRNYCVGVAQDGNKLYEGRLILTVSGYGELVMRIRSGQIRHADNPVLVYEEDNFSFGDNDGRKTVNYTCNFPHKSNHIVACYLKITRPDGSIDYSVMFEEDWERLSDFSARNNRRWDNNTRQWLQQPNELYVSNDGRIDAGFLAAKCIKHAFKTYPNVRLGKATIMESDLDEHQQEINDFYGVGGEAEKPAMPQDPNPAFGNPEDLSAGVTVEADNKTIDDDGTF